MFRNINNACILLINLIKNIQKSRQQNTTTYFITVPKKAYKLIKKLVT